MEEKERLIDLIIDIAQDFECCPVCGNEQATQHFCKQCKQRFVERESAFFFSSFLRKAKDRGDFEKYGIYGKNGKGESIQQSN